MFSLEFSQRIDSSNMEGMGHAHLHTFWVAAAQVTFCCALNRFIQMHVSEGTGLNTHTAAKTDLPVNNYSRGLRVPFDPVDRADFHAGRGVALQTRAGINFSPLHVHMDKDIGAAPILLVVLIKLACLLATEASNAPVKFHVYKGHSVRFQSLSVKKSGDVLVLSCGSF
jgi:hypothetical protein